MPSAPIATTLPVGPGQVQGRSSAVSALAQALSSSDPQTAELGKTLLSSLLTGSQQDKQRAFEASQMLASQGFQQSQQGRAQAFEGGQNAQNRGLTAANAAQTQEGANARTAAEIASREKIAGMKPPLEGSASIQEYNLYASQEKAAGRTPLSFDEWQNRDANRKKSTAAPATVVIQTQDDQGNKVTKIVPKVAGATYSGAPTAQESNRRDQADIVERQVDHVMALIDKTPDAVGPILGRLAKGETVVGNVAPEAKALATALGSLEALQPILHGYRGGSQTMDHFHSIIGDQALNAAALKASLKEIKALAADIRSGGADSQAAAPNVNSVLDKVFGPAPKSK
jgi:hypothetical protein